MNIILEHLIGRFFQIASCRLTDFTGDYPHNMFIKLWEKRNAMDDKITVYYIPKF